MQTIITTTSGEVINDGAIFDFQCIAKEHISGSISNEYFQSECNIVKSTTEEMHQLNLSFTATGAHDDIKTKAYQFAKKCSTCWISFDNDPYEYKAYVSSRTVSYLNYNQILVELTFDVIVCYPLITQILNSDDVTIDLKCNKPSPINLEIKALANVSATELTLSYIDNQENEYKQVISFDLSAGDTIVVDSEAFKVTKDGTNYFQYMSNMMEFIYASDYINIIADTDNLEISMNYKGRI